MQRVAIVGVGLIGGSLGLALRRARPSLEIMGVTHNEAAAAAALARGAVTSASVVLGGAVRQADLVVIATPIRAIPGVIRGLASILPPDALVTDVASVKCAVLDWVQASLPQPERFLGGHPMAGRTESGLNGAQPGLFSGEPWIVTPVEGQSIDRFQPFLDLLEAIGARPLVMPAPDHDRDVALVSHLAFTVSAAFAASARRPEYGDQPPAIAGPGYRDMARLAGGDPELYTDIARANRVPLLAALDRFSEVLAEYRGRIDRGDAWSAR